MNKYCYLSAMNSATASSGHYISNEGKNRAICGNITSKIMNAKNAIKYGIDARTNATELQFNIPHTVYIHMPTGGVFAPNKVSTTKIIPKCIGSKPASSAIGNKMGVSSRIITLPSNNIPASAINASNKKEYRICFR